MNTETERIANEVYERHVQQAVDQNQVCACKHIRFWHHGAAGNGRCLFCKAMCQCMEFES